MEYKLQKLMEDSKEVDLKGYVKADEAMKFKTIDGELYTWNKHIKKWVTPRITYAWFCHTFVVTSRGMA